MTNKEAISELEIMLKGCDYDEQFDALDLAIKVLEGKPQGKWIKDENGIDRCSECGNRCITFVMGKPSDKFCIECGADMRGDNNDR